MTEHILPPPTTKRPPSYWAIAASLLLNLLFAAVLIWVSYVWKREDVKMAAEQQMVQVDLVPAQPPTQPQAQPQQQAQQQPEKKQAEQQPEKKEPEKKEPDKKEPEKQPEKQPEKPEKQQDRLAKPAPPQLRQARLSEKSSTDRRDEHNGANGQNVAIAMGDGPMLSMRTSNEDGARGPEGSRGPIGQELSQNEQDYVLSQILPYWKVDTHRPEGRGMVLEAVIEINADGTLMHPLGRDDPWNPNAIISGYSEMVRLGYSYRREALEGFLLALRLSQPIKVPPGGKWPKWMKLRFAFDDL